MPTITADSILTAARERGVPAFDAAPCSVIPTKILLASIADVSDPAIARQLLDLHLAGAIHLARVDMAGFVPEERRDLLARSAIRHMGAMFDVIAVEGWTMPSEVASELLPYSRLSGEERDSLADRAFRRADAERCS